MSSLNNETTRLVLVGVGASFAGAALALGVMSRFLKGSIADDNSDYVGRPRRSNSFIFEDPDASSQNYTSSTRSSGVLFPHNHEERMRRLVAARAAVEDENSLPRQSVTVRVPATSANMGPGCK
jgi:homoserine kinase